MADRLPDRRVPLASAPNLRDLGGIPVTGGVVRRGLLYRSASLAKLEGPDETVFAGLGITTVYDLRSAAERSGALDHLPEGTRTVWLDVVADAPGNVAANIPTLLADPGALAEALGEGRAGEYLADANRSFISLPSALTAFRQFYLDLLDARRTGAALVHCTTGKDRTGWAAASFLLLLGASEADVRSDYLQTNTDLAPTLQPILAALDAQGVDTTLIRPILEVRDNYLDAALDEMRSRYGDIHTYARTGLGLTDEQIESLHARFVDPIRTESEASGIR
ncbi:tyrosine-protein phosphatase [Herbiconiux sp. P17]|uniref:tyrosine-protein phosphatase n=1 Tax=Herbiconiux wuyangfengii TaxID=3342794 RepID=UPI0035B74424